MGCIVFVTVVVRRCVRRRCHRHHRRSVLISRTICERFRTVYPRDQFWGVTPGDPPGGPGNARTPLGDPPGDPPKVAPGGISLGNILGGVLGWILWEEPLGGSPGRIPGPPPQGPWRDSPGGCPGVIHPGDPPGGSPPSWLIRSGGGASGKAPRKKTSPHWKHHLIFLLATSFASLLCR
jgi:hypothetical protein